MPADDKAAARSLEEILYQGYPREHQYKSITGKIRRGERKKAIAQIVEIYRCNDDEAGIVFRAMKEIAVGKRTTIVEIPLTDVTQFKGDLSRNPLSLTPRFLARTGYRVGRLTLDKHGYSVDGERVRSNEIDQVWKVVDAT
jgi:hypothetical protein